MERWGRVGGLGPLGDFEGVGDHGPGWEDSGWDGVDFLPGWREGWWGGAGGGVSDEVLVVDVLGRTLILGLILCLDVRARRFRRGFSCS